MKIYTSYFANLKNIPSNIVPISIAKWAPKGINIQQYFKLAPSGRLLSSYKNGLITPKQYEIIYIKENLEKLSYDELLRDLSDMSQGKDVVLLCYETKDKFCHRNIVAQNYPELKIKEI